MNASADNSDGSDIISTSPLTLVDSDGNTIEINYILHKDYSCEYRGDDGMKYTDNGNETYTDENGNTYSALTDETIILEPLWNSMTLRIRTVIR